MEQLVTGKQMKELDAYTINQMGIPSLVLMERAALSVFEAMKKERLPLQNVLVLCGAGNNGADGAAVARLLCLAGYRVDICILGNPEHFTEEMKCQIEIAEKYGVSFVKTFCCDEYTTIVDALVGVGLSRAMSGKYSEIIEKINASSAKIVSVDIPSGIHADTGAVMQSAVKADLTVTFAYKKAGLCLFPGAEYAGKILTADIGIYKDKKTEWTPDLFACTADDLKKIKRKPNGNKGTFGKILLIAGSRDIFGAAYLCGLAAMKTGAGMLKICTRKENKILFSCFPEAMLSIYDAQTDIYELLRKNIEWADVVGIGPGIGTSGQAEELLNTVLHFCRKPLVIDADAINCLSKSPDTVGHLREHPAELIFTPHLGEFSRLTGISVEKWKENPLTITEETAKMLHFVLVCKDARTVISNGDGDIYLNLSGNDGMATAGSGDVLTGIILGLLAQGIPSKEAAYLGVYLHGLAGDAAALKKGKAGMLAGDLIEETAQILRGI